MPIRTTRRTLLRAALVPVAGLIAGCGGSGDSPKLAEAPKFTAPPEQEAPKIPGRKQTYGASKKYQDAMERANTR